MSSLDITFRLGTAADAVRLSAFAEGIYRATFSPWNTPEDMDIYCASAFGPDIQLRELREPKMTTLIAEHANEPVAYAQLSNDTSDDCVAGTRPVELRRFYVAARYHGTALARELMSRVIHLAHDAGHDVLWLGVWERNSRAIRFYEKCGFRAVGDHLFWMGNDRQRDLVMSLRVGHSN
jgi:diamine N-acetyltransferase